MKLNYELVGTLNITADKIDITDPCYDKDVWCRTQKPITPGEYNCYVGIGSNKNWGTRVYMLILLAADIDLDSKGDVENVGTIGVDAGMAGFFENKPDYSDEEWNKVCDYVFEGFESGNSKKHWIVDADTPLRCKGFFSESGIGDGEYVVYQLKKRNRIVGYKLAF